MTTSPMAALVPALRRHARMLLGAGAAADDLVVAALERLLAAPDLDVERLRDRAFVMLYRALADGEAEAASPQGIAAGAEGAADGRLQMLPLPHRAVLLLLTVERFSADSVRSITGLSGGEVRAYALEAQAAIEHALRTTVLIVEDEWTIARDLRRIVSSLGHEVSGMASSRGQAIEMAERLRPGLILADVNLEEGGSGFDAVRDILALQKVPTVFVTGFPRQVLGHPRPSPTYLVTKPFSPAMIRSTVSQALFFG